jgi:hypothetical protein
MLLPLRKGRAAARRRPFYVAENAPQKTLQLAFKTLLHCRLYFVSNARRAAIVRDDVAG